MKGALLPRAENGASSLNSGEVIVAGTGAGAGVGDGAGFRKVGS
jgi:hypothetical protein